ncbi:MAG: DUF11 domain-containing protein [Parvularculaceae bacterium]|nr:DUF11 domain-containing protein [Parvularculaceae bacterium]
MKTPLAFAASALALLAAAPASAAMTAKQIVEKEVIVRAANGDETIKRLPADKVAPGETVVYSIKYQNDSAEAASDIVLVMPVPKEVAYVEGSVSGDDANVTFSADGGKTYVARGRLTVVEGGAARPARGDEITHIRWTLQGPVPPKADGEVSYKGILR